MNKEMTIEEYQEFLNTIDTLPKKENEIIRRGVLQLNDDKKALVKEIYKLKDKLENKRKEYQETYKDVRIELKEKNQEIDKYKNIIDELEKWINNEIAIHIDDDILPVIYECILSRLKQLKEGK